MFFLHTKKAINATKKLILYIIVALLIFTSVCTVSAEQIYKNGDCNLDGKIDSRDSLSILKYSANIISFSDLQKTYADFNNDDKVNTVDSLKILLFLVSGSDIPVEIVVFEIPRIILKLNESFEQKCTILPIEATNKSVKWSSTNDNIAVVDQNGKITANAYGETNITATAESGAYSQCSVIVQKAQDEVIVPQKITLSQEKLNLFLNENSTLSANIYPENASNKSIKWSSSDTDIAVVDSLGAITAKAVGTTQITAKTSNGIEEKCYIYVNQKNVPLPQGDFMIMLYGTNRAMALETLPAENSTNILLKKAESKSFASQVFNFPLEQSHIIALKSDLSYVLDVYRKKDILEIGQNIDIYKNIDPQAQKWSLIKLYNGAYAITLDALEYSAVAARANEENSNVFLDKLDFQNPLIQWTFSNCIEKEKQYNAFVSGTENAGLNVRQEPTATSLKVGFFTEGQSIIVVGDSIYGWYKVVGTSSNGKKVEGFCKGIYIIIKDEIIDIPDDVPVDKDTIYFNSMIGKTLGNIGIHGNHGTYYCNPDNPLDPLYCGQCTWYAFGRFKELTKINLYYARNAKNWLIDNTNDSRVKVTENKYDISSKSIAVSLKGTYGHVMIVEYVQRDSNGSPVAVFFTESNWANDPNGNYVPGDDGILKTMSFVNFLSSRAIAGYISKA